MIHEGKYLHPEQIISRSLWPDKTALSLALSATFRVTCSATIKEKKRCRMYSLSLEKPTKKTSKSGLNKAKPLLALVMASGLMLSLGCRQSETDRPHRYEATVVKTEYGIPHITAESWGCLLYTSPSPRDRQKSRMPSSA